MKLLKLVPAGTDIKFMKKRMVAITASVLLMIASVIGVSTIGLNFGIDFRGGILVEVKTPVPADMAALRAKLADTELGQIDLQEFGAPDVVLINVERQQGDNDAQKAAVAALKSKLESLYPQGLDYRRTEFVGPKVSGELIQDGVIAVVLAAAAMLFYIWLRFELQFSLGAIAALVHDVVLTLGFFVLIGQEFNLSTIAALLTIVGYSINDTVVVYDRVRENLRRYKVMEIPDLIDRTINETLSRTVMTSLTTALALFALYLFGGEVIRGFTLAMIWGVFVGTYSSIFVAGPLLVWLGVKRPEEQAEVNPFAEAEKAAGLSENAER